MAKENKKRKGNLKYSILLLLLIAILLITSTYAWFTANSVVQVDTLDVHVAAQNGLQISVDAEEWKTSISKEDILAATYASARNQVPYELQAVSTGGNVSAGLLEMFLGTIDSNEGGQQTLTATAETDETGASNETGNYIAFDMYLRVDSAADIVLTQNSNVIFSGTDRGLQNAARVAFIVEGNAEATADASGIQGQMTGSDAIIWEPNNDVHTASAVTHARQNYGATIQQTGSTPVEYSGVSAEIADGILLAETNADDNAEYFTDVDVDISTAQTMGADQDFVHLEAGVTKIRVYAWIEGQDYDCENGASGAEIFYNMEFAIKQGAGA